MNQEAKRYIDNLNHPDKEVRLENLKKLQQMITEGRIEKIRPCGAVNNHIHTSYSFSPYSPTKAVWMAYQSGLITAGIMDHDSISGAKEFLRAGEILGIATTIGLECRVDFSNTPLAGKRINNPDQKSIAYVALHGIPHTQIDTVIDFFKPYTEKRNARNRKMIDKINALLTKFDVTLDFDKDVVPLSMAHEGGSITERHLLFALSMKLIEKYDKGQALVSFLTDDLGLNISDKVKAYLLDEENEHYAYDLLGALKSDMVSQFYIAADAECPDVSKVIDLSKQVGAIAAYAYLGDVGTSVTGDKKSQKFEDDYLEMLFEVLKAQQFNAVTYMPSRNTKAQLERLRALCKQHDLFEISGEDINSPRQSFICEAMKDPMFANLIDATWALIGHEREATKDINAGMFTLQTINQIPSLTERIEVYKKATNNR